MIVSLFILFLLVLYYLMHFHIELFIVSFILRLELLVFNV